MVEKRASVIISTPGRFDWRRRMMTRVLDLMNLEVSSEEEKKPKQQYLSLDRVNYLVVDEADLMLDISSLPLSFLPSLHLGFKEQLNLMFSSIPRDQSYQTVCCSATYTDRVEEKEMVNG